MTLIKEPKKWYVKLFTLGKNFSSRTFSDNSKKFLLNAIGLFVVVTFTFYVESVGDDYEDRQKYLDISKGILAELHLISSYTDGYIEQIDWVTEMYKKQYDKWELDNDSVFIDFVEDEEEPDGKYYFAPMGFYVQRDPFDPPRVNFDAIKLDGTFRLLPKEVGLKVTNIYDGTDLKYLIENTGKNEERYVNQFIDQIANKWVYDLPWVDLDYNEFWIENREYIQNDKFIKYNLYKRLDLWQFSVKDQLQLYRNSLIEGTVMLDSVIAVRESEFEFIWWVLNPKD